MGLIIRYKGDKVVKCVKKHDYELSKKSVHIKDCMKCRFRHLITCGFEDGIV